MRLLEDVLDIDGGKKKPTQEKLQAYLGKEKTYPLYAYQFQPISTVYERTGKNSSAEVLHPTYIYDLLEFSIRKCVKNFAIPRRNTAAFCNLTVNENGQTCRIKWISNS